MKKINVESNSTNKKMRIIMFGHKRIPSRSGGIETVLTELCPKLVLNGFEITVINRAGEKIKHGDYQPVRHNFKGVKVKNVPSIRLKGLSAVISSFFAAFIAAFGPYDLVHIHAEGPSVMIWLPHLMRKKCIVTVHGLDWKRDKWHHGFGAHYIHFGEKMLSKYADAIIVLNKDTQKYFKKTYNRNTFYIPNGVKKSDQIEPSIITKKFGLFGDDYFLTVSRLTPEKGLLPLIESFRGVDTNKKLVIVGDGSDTDEYVKKIIKLSQSDSRIIFTGFVGGRLLSELYSNAFVYIIPSFVEGMPMSLLEALSFGNAVAASNIPEITEVVGRDHALLFSPKDQNQMKNVINRFLHDTRLRRAMKQSSKNYVADKYSWNIVAHETSKVYLQVLFKGE